MVAAAAPTPWQRAGKTRQKHITLLKKALSETVVTTQGHLYKVNFGPDVIPRTHFVDKEKICNCGLGEECPAFDAAKDYLKNGGEYAQERPLGKFPTVPNRCPVCQGHTHSAPLLSSQQRGAGWECAHGGSLHYWKALSQDLAKLFAFKHFIIAIRKITQASSD